MGCKTRILRPSITQGKSYLNTDAETDLVIALYYYFKTTISTPRYPKVYYSTRKVLWTIC